ncbi:hypothetical protein AMTR_s00136p00096000 [Amborella trichopoda]|uniref:Aminotransferase-like plant mobile domain-containing protein n=1 Tax=Amborella trichopoda TaxID=13333 RepID=W1NFN5_AMBTC|nr:hypothetical protein AMTR_s00136p00096000 [Amborella trichopoda]
MTPTLFDVYEILTLVVDGAPVTYRPINDYREYIESQLGEVPLEATMLTRYLQFFEDTEQASGYAWGVASLAYLYRSLEKSCTFKCRHFSGSTTLMQRWT